MEKIEQVPQVKRKSLSPQAAEYYKRLVLLTDRFLVLVKERRNLRIKLWLTAIVAIIEALMLTERYFPVILKKLTELLG